MPNGLETRRQKPKRIKPFNPLLPFLFLMPELFKPQQITSLGKLRLFRTPSGTKVVILPTCTVPLHHLVEENWGDAKGVIPRSRPIKKVTTLKDGSSMETAIYIKSIAFETEPPRLMRPNNKKTFEEARKLLYLHANDEKVEIPQAIILRKNKPYKLLTTEIKGTSLEDEESPFKEIGNELARLQQKGIDAIDVKDANLIRAPNEELHHIDVEDWNIPEIERKNRRTKK